MKLWLLQPRRGLGENNPWKPWYDRAFGFVVRADTEDDARRMVLKSSSEDYYLNEPNAGGDEMRDFNPWLDPAFSTCEELTAEGEARVILRDFRAA